MFSPAKRRVLFGREAAQVARGGRRAPLPYRCTTQEDNAHDGLLVALLVALPRYTHGVRLA